MGDGSFFPHLALVLTPAFGMTSQWLLYILALPTNQIPQTISTSYGDDEQTGNDDLCILDASHHQCRIQAPVI